MNEQNKGRRFLLLGGSSELSLAFLRCNEWNENDWIIAQYCHHDEELRKIAATIPARLDLLYADFMSEDSTKQMAQTLVDKAFVPTHILHVPAVPVVNQRFTDLQWSEAESQIHVQCRSLVIVLQAVIRKMAKAHTGRIVIGLSSCTLNVPPKYLASYVQAKYALMGIAKALAAEYAPKGILVNMISPSMMETKFLDNVYGGVVEKSAMNNPMKRNASPSDAGKLICYLFSEANTFITGANIPITGGEVF